MRLFQFISSTRPCRLTAYAQTGYTFDHWLLPDGTEVTDSSFDYTKGQREEEVIAYFTFTPYTPSEPNDPIVRHNLTVQTGTHELLSFKVNVPEDAPTGVGHQVKINQISMQMEDGTTITARTRNGVIVVYKRGDANGDNRLTVADVVALTSANMGEPVETFIPEAADVDEDGAVSANDIQELITGKLLVEEEEEPTE